MHKCKSSPCIDNATSHLYKVTINISLHMVNITSLTVRVNGNEIAETIAKIAKNVCGHPVKNNLKLIFISNKF